MFAVSLITKNTTPIEQANRCTDAIPSTYNTLQDLATTICSYHWSPILFKNNYRLGENFNSVSILAFDFDDGLSLSNAVERFDGYQNIIVTTRHHQIPKNQKPACDRFRVLLFLQQPILDKDQYKATYNYFLDTFCQEADRQCADLARKYYPGKEIISCQQGECLEVPDFSILKKTEEISFEAIVRGIKAAIGPATQKFLKNPPARGDGKWHYSFLKACTDLKRCHYTKEEAINLLEEAIKRVPNGTGFLSKEDLYQIDDVYLKRKTKLSGQFSRPLRVWNDQDHIDICLPFLDDNFVILKKKSGERRYYARDSKTNEVELLESLKPVSEALVLFVRESTIDMGREEIPDAKFTGKAMYLWEVLSLSTIEDEPEPFCFADDNRLTFKKFDFVLNQGPYNAWEEFLTRLSDPACFMAFVWSIFDKRNKGRQILWLQGRGQDGKSRVFEAIQSVLGVSAGALNGIALGRDSSRFMFSQFYGKRAAFYSDCLNPRFPMNEFVRNVTGGDTVTIEYKTKTPFAARIHLKVLVASNFNPEISSQVSDKSRLLFLKVSPSKVTDDPFFVDKLQKELPYFLYACQEHYNRLCPNHGDIRYNDDVAENLEEAHSSLEEPYDCFFETYLEIDETSRLSRTELWKCAAESKIFNASNPNFQWGFKRWLESKKGLTVKKSKGTYYYPKLKLKGLL